MAVFRMHQLIWPVLFFINYSHETNLDNYQVILVKLSAGNNNLLHKENVLSDISPQQGPEVVNMCQNY
jgi:hypothetical protein